MGAAREALVIATGTYEDEALRRLRSPAQDAEALGRVLADPQIGGFHVEQLVDQTQMALRLRLHEFFKGRARDDVLLIHLSCHGIKDDEGRLYFAATDTRHDALEVTSVPAAFLNDQMEYCRARSIVLLLDCCYAGAFAAGSKGDGGVHLKEQFAGHGRAILTASNAIEYAWEGGELSGEPRPSVFTAAAVEGLASGEADRDGDGRVSIYELHEFVTERMRRTEPKQTPLKWELGVEGGLYIARNPRARPALPAPVLEALAHPLASVRAAVAADLEGLLSSSKRATSSAARDALERLLDDDSKRVRTAAAAALDRGPDDEQDEDRRRSDERDGDRDLGEEQDDDQKTDPRRVRRSVWPERIVAGIRRRPAYAGVAAVLAVLLVLAPSLLGGDPDDNGSASGDTTEEGAEDPTEDGATEDGTDGADEHVVELAVAGTMPWTDTGVDLEAGDEVTITASGEVYDDVSNNPERSFTPDGVPDTIGEHPGDPHQGLNHAALLGRVGDDGEVVQVGSEHSFTAAGAGRLFLGINDGLFDDNDGAYDAVVTVTRPVAAATGGFSAP